MWIPRQYQIELAVEGYHVLKENMIVYLAMEERTGKSLTAILIAEMCSNVNTVVVVTTAKAIEGWEEHLANYTASLDIILTTYGKAKKLTIKPDLVILDESHKNIGGYPKPSSTWKSIAKLTANVPLVYCSATPHAQGYQSLYHQFALSSWSPWSKFKTFYTWFTYFGIPSSQWISGREIAKYDKTKEDLVLPYITHLFISKTRKELDFTYEPKDKLHYVTLSQQTKKIYNELLKHKVVNLSGRVLIADSPPRLRFALHMLEGGGVKIDADYVVLNNREKVDFIKHMWGDVPSLVIFYNYKVEKLKLEAEFKHASVLQATSYAEGVDLTDYDTLVIYSQDFSTARHTQRRARQASKHRNKEIIVHYLLVEKAISEQCYEAVSINKQNFVDSVFEREEL